MLQRRALLLVLFILPALAGCGSDRPETAHVTGRITMDGVPVKTGTIMFYPTAGRPAVGLIQTDGTYRLTTSDKDDGAQVGKHIVTIEATEIIGGSNPKSFEEEAKVLRPGELKILVPLEYGDRATSLLQAEVESKDNTINFDLKKLKLKKP